MFENAGYNASNWSNIGTLSIYANNSSLSFIFKNARYANATLNIYNNPYNFYNAFLDAATEPGSGIRVNYSVNVTYIDNIINTKSAGSNVIKGSQLD